MKNYKEIIFKWRLKKSRERNYLTIKAHEYQWEKNLKYNAKQKIFQTAKSIGHIAAKIGENRTIWILGAGYSLEQKKAEFRQNLKPTDIIFCVDASLSYVVNEIGVIPDFVFILDSKKEGLRFFKNIPEEVFKKTAIVVSSAVDREFLPIIEKFGEFYAFHMYDPSMPVWGGESPNAAHKLLPNLNYIANRGNVFNLALQVAFHCQPKEVNGLGVEHCYLFDENGNIRTRARVNDGFDYSVGGDFCRLDKLVFVETPNGRFFTQGDYYAYARMAKQIIANSGFKFNNYSGGLL